MAVIGGLLIFAHPEVTVLSVLSAITFVLVVIFLPSYLIRSDMKRRVRAIHKKTGFVANIELRSPGDFHYMGFSARSQEFVFISSFGMKVMQRPLSDIYNYYPIVTERNGHTSYKKMVLEFKDYHTPRLKMPLAMFAMFDDTWDRLQMIMNGYVPNPCEGSGKHFVKYDAVAGASETGSKTRVKPYMKAACLLLVIGVAIIATNHYSDRSDTIVRPTHHSFTATPIAKPYKAVKVICNKHTMFPELENPDCHGQ